MNFADRYPGILRRRDFNRIMSACLSKTLRPSQIAPTTRTLTQIPAQLQEKEMACTGCSLHSRQFRPQPIQPLACPEEAAHRKQRKRLQTPSPNWQCAHEHEQLHAWPHVSPDRPEFPRRPLRTASWDSVFEGVYA